MRSIEGANRETLKGAEVLVVGLGRSGTAAVELLAGWGATVTAVDDDPSAAERIDAAPWRRRGIVVRTGDAEPGALASPDLVLVSPGVPHSSRWVRWARDLGVPVASEIEVASWGAGAPIVGVTGTNGKSTTTELLGEIVRAWGRRVEVAGNIGRALSRVVEDVPPDGWIVAEISSFQLETIHRFRPKVAVYLNLTPDHLDRYESLDAYRRAKERIFENQTEEDVAVLNSQDPRVWSVREHIRARVLGVSRSGPVEAGAWIEGGRIWARVAGDRISVCDVAALRLRGPHNVSNALAAVAASLSIGVPAARAAAALRSFRGLPHRMESLGRVGGIEFVNDSKATNVAAVLSALEGFSAPVVLIAGGLGKGLDFRPLAEAARNRVKRAVLIGEAQEQMRSVLGPVTEVDLTGSMPEAVRRAFSAGSPGDVVLLSPACASFDMFENFEDRGRAFRAEVERLRGGTG